MSEPATIFEAFRSTVSAHPTADAVIDDQIRLNWLELSEQVDVTARALLAAGLKRGDRIAIWAPNCWEWVAVSLAGLSLGVVIVPLNTRYKGPEAAYILRRSEARLLFTVDDFLAAGYVGLLDGLDLGKVEEIIVLRGHAPAQTLDFATFTARALNVAGDDLPQRRAEVSGEDLSEVIFTGGTTGAPKGVLTTQSQALQGYTTWAELAGLSSQDRYLIVNPFFHSFGYRAGILACVITGAAMIPIPVFDVKAVIDAIATERVTVFPGPPALYQSILNHPDRAQIPTATLRIAITGAAPVPVSLIDELRNHLGFDSVITAYGLSEASGIVSMCHQDDSDEVVATSSGRAIPGVEIKTIDETGMATKPGTPGEILVRGFNVMKGYLDDESETAEVIDSEGWLHTGDIGTLSAEGNLAITDRTKDMFICGGFNAYPAEIESMLVAHPAISQAAVIGVPDQRLGEVGFAYLVTAAGQLRPKPDELTEWARDQMANFKVPRTFRWIESLPTTPSGKIQKFQLRELAEFDDLKRET